MSAEATGCAGHAELADELREYAAGALNLIEPWLAQIRERPADPAAPEPASCPLCAVITVLRGGRSELAVKVAEQATGLLVVLRAALAEGAGSRPDQPPGSPSRGGDGVRLPAERRGVQRIMVAREEDASSRTC